MAHIKFRTHIENGTDHKDLFLNQIRTKAPTYESNFIEIVKNGFDVDKMDFYTYALFEDFNANNPFFNSFQGFSRNAIDRKLELDRVFIVGPTVGFQFKGNTNTQIMYSGCGIGLCAANRIFNLTNADYNKIKEKRGRLQAGHIPGQNKTLDFEYSGSDGKRIFRVECKGKEGINNNISAKIKHILEKKTAQPAGVRDFCFGIIGLTPVLPDRKNAIAYFVDPEVPDLDIDPLTFRLSARLRYYADRMSNLGNSKWIRQIKKLFYNSNSREFQYQIINKTVENVEMSLRAFIGVENYRPLTTGYHFKCTLVEIAGQRVFSRLALVKENEYFFYGFLEDIFETIAYKTIGDFLNYKSQPKEIKWSDTMSVWDGHLDKDDIFMVGSLTINTTGEVSGTLFSEKRDRTD
ncbi:MAG TPA: hypothetical protein VIN07_14555 [Flavipsychrobacter sp.]